MDKALIVIDYTNDFIADDGKLTCSKPGQAIDGYIAEQIQLFGTEKQFIVFLNDIHFEGDIYHPETNLFPQHNIFGTEGRKVYGRTGNELSMREGMDNVRVINKTRYSAFAGTNLSILLRERGINEVHLVGVCTDICVLHTAIEAYGLGFKVVVHEKGVASFDPNGHEWALKHMKNILGAEII
jgi:nicotinamidase-related amidase